MARTKYTPHVICISVNYYNFEVSRVFYAIINSVIRVTSIFASHPVRSKDFILQNHLSFPLFL